MPSNKILELEIPSDLIEIKGVLRRENGMAMVYWYDCKLKARLTIIAEQGITKNKVDLDVLLEGIEITAWENLFDPAAMKERFTRSLVSKGIVTGKDILKFNKAVRAAIVAAFEPDLVRILGAAKSEVK